VLVGLREDLARAAARRARPSAGAEVDGELLRRGAILVDEGDPSDRVRAVLVVEQAIRDGAGNLVLDRPIFVEADGSGLREVAAPSFDLRPPDERERAKIAPPALDENDLLRWVKDRILPSRIAAVAAERTPLVDRIAAEVAARVRGEIDYGRERGGVGGAAAQRANDRIAALRERLAAREAAFAAERRLEGGEARLVAAWLVVPRGAVS
jgi:hypothetical protein